MSMQLDHVILLLPYRDITDPPAWLADNFVISPGGRHADNKTENRLVLFKDGTYLELIAFIDDDPARREGHWWDKPYGVVDYAFTTPEQHLDYGGVVSRLKQAQSQVSYQQPQAGGRTKPDGSVIKWEVTFPTGIERGAMPFFCHDVTPRDRRVPVSDENTDHPCGAFGMAGMLEQVDVSRLSEVGTALRAITNVTTSAEDAITVGAPISIDGLAPPTVKLVSLGDQSLTLGLRLQVPDSERKVPKNIEQEIDGGKISIVFERPTSRGR